MLIVQIVSLFVALLLTFHFGPSATLASLARWFFAVGRSLERSANRMAERHQRNYERASGRVVTELEAVQSTK